MNGKTKIMTSNKINLELDKVNFEQIIEEAQAKVIVDKDRNVDDLEAKVNLLEPYFTEFFPFLKLLNKFTFGGSPIVFRDKSEDDEEKRILAELRKNSRSFIFIDLKEIALKISFMINDDLTPLIKLSIKQEFSEGSNQYLLQEDAAKRIAEIVLKYKD